MVFKEMLKLKLYAQHIKLAEINKPENFHGYENSLLGLRVVQ